MLFPLNDAFVVTLCSDYVTCTLVSEKSFAFPNNPTMWEDELKSRWRENNPPREPAHHGWKGQSNRQQVESSCTREWAKEGWNAIRIS